MNDPLDCLLQCITIRSGLLLTAGIPLNYMHSNLAPGNYLAMTFCLTFLPNFLPCIIFTIKSPSMTVAFFFFFSTDCPVFTVSYSFIGWWNVVSETTSIVPSVSWAVAKTWKNSTLFLLFLVLLDFIMLYVIKISSKEKFIFLFTSTLHFMFLSSLFRGRRFSFCIIMLFLLPSRRKLISGFSIAVVSWLHDTFPKSLRTQSLLFRSFNSSQKYSFSATSSFPVFGFACCKIFSWCILRLY